MKLGLIMAQLMASKCKFRGWEFTANNEAYRLADMRRYNQMYLIELMEIDVERITTADDVKDELIYDIYIKL